MLLPLLFLADTIHLVRAAHPIVFDGRADTAEYGTPSIAIARPAGTVRIWLRREGDSVFIAADLPDSTWYWGDDLVISLDVRGAGGEAPGLDQFQWYFRRMLDSSVVDRGRDGTWHPPRDDPDWRLGGEREGGGWAVRSAERGTGWSLELRLDAAWFTEARNGAPRIAFRTYDDTRSGWYAWPSPPGLPSPTEVERRPSLWAVVARN
ncbi:MAG TPA: hypothetical protein VNH46_03380 [Gemmatimonadales bacterium]|nr:hypothetical protein [Gemmatimonadales bacterium]